MANWLLESLRRVGDYAFAARLRRPNNGPDPTARKLRSVGGNRYRGTGGIEFHGRQVDFRRAVKSRRRGPIECCQRRSESWKGAARKEVNELRELPGYLERNQGDRGRKIALKRALQRPMNTLKAAPEELCPAVFAMDYHSS